jgi:predicted metal-dependent enzyme (double-stranded beta helix superfamily)
MPNPKRTARRRAAVARAIQAVRDIETSRGVTRAALEEIAGILDTLALDQALFDIDDFPDPEPGARARLYLLSEDDDGRFPLYLTCSRPGGSVPPHNHSTWAVVSGLSGEEENALWERTDPGNEPGPASLRETRRVTVRAGEHLALLPDDIHSVSTPGEVPRRHFHMYGLSLERLPRRFVYDTDAGQCRYMETNPKIVRVAHA